MVKGGSAEEWHMEKVVRNSKGYPAWREKVLILIYR